MAQLDSPDFIRRIAPLLWGTRQWRAEMSQALGVGDRAIRKWVAAEAEVPIGVWRAMLHLIRQRQRELDEGAAEIEAHVGEAEQR